jgi:hypothetical protein
MKIALVGILNNSDWPPNLERWRSPSEQANIRLVLDEFDQSLRSLAASNGHVLFFDDRVWFQRYWGARDERGEPNYLTAHFPGWGAVTNSQGDAPANAIIGDGHAGTLLNALWVRDFVDFLVKRGHLGLTPISDTDLERFAHDVVG